MARDYCGVCVNLEDTVELDFSARLAAAEAFARNAILPDREKARNGPSPMSSPTPVVDEDPAILEIARRASIRTDAADKALGARSGFAPSEWPGAARIATVDNRLYIPRGSMAIAFYDRSDVVGTSGPAGTGKSRGWLEKLHLIAEKYKGCRLAICRKTRESLTESALFTYEDKVLPPGHPALVGPRRSHRQSYLYPNGSVINVAGLDKPQKLMSTEYDIIYVQEAIECDDFDFELLTTRLRNGIVPYQQLVFDCNPDSPTHWLYLKTLSGEYKMLDTRHEDNPLWFEEAPANVEHANHEWPHKAEDGRVGRWTDRGVKYIEKLDALVGARKQRLRYGRWTSSEGQIYDKWDRVRHVVPRRNPPRDQGYWIWVVDFGFVRPMCIQMWWIDNDGRPSLWKEIYMTQRLVEDHAKEALDAAGWTYDKELGHIEIPGREYVADLPSVIVADHDSEGRATFEDRVGMFTIPATKAILEGIDAVKVRMKFAEDGKPGMSIMEGCLVEKDQALVDAMQPTSSIEEVTAYVWDTGGATGRKRGEKPIDEYNHGMDCWRYLVCHLDGVSGGQNAKASQIAQATAADDHAMVVAFKNSERRIGDRQEKRRARVEARERLRGWRR